MKRSNTRDLAATHLPRSAAAIHDGGEDKRFGGCEHPSASGAPTDATEPSGIDYDFLGKPLPQWTKQYPSNMRKFFYTYGTPPEAFPRAHERNLRILEAGKAIEVAGRLMRRSSDFSLLKRIFLGTMMFTDVGDGAARSLEEINVKADWLSMYPPEYARLLSEHGVPTIARSDVDLFNRRLVELLPPDCIDPVQLRDALEDALYYAFGRYLLAWYESSNATIPISG